MAHRSRRAPLELSRRCYIPYNSNGLGPSVPLRILGPWRVLPAPGSALCSGLASGQIDGRKGRAAIHRRAPATTRRGQRLSSLVGITQWLTNIAHEAAVFCQRRPARSSSNGRIARLLWRRGEPDRSGVMCRARFFVTGVGVGRPLIIWKRTVVGTRAPPFDPATAPMTTMASWYAQ